MDSKAILKFILDLITLGLSFYLRRRRQKKNDDPEEVLQEGTENPTNRKNT